MACGILVPLTMWSPNHWTSREVPDGTFQVVHLLCFKNITLPYRLFLSTLSLYLSGRIFVPVHVKTVCKFWAGPLLSGGKFFPPVIWLTSPVDSQGNIIFLNSM